MGSAQQSVKVDLGPMSPRVEDRVRSGAYSSATEVLEAALDALDREEKGLAGWLCQEAERSLADAEPDVPAIKVFEELEHLHRRAPTQ